MPGVPLPGLRAVVVRAKEGEPSLFAHTGSYSTSPDGEPTGGRGWVPYQEARCIRCKSEGKIWGKQNKTIRDACCGRYRSLRCATPDSGDCRFVWSASTNCVSGSWQQITSLERSSIVRKGELN